MKKLKEIKWFKWIGRALMVLSFYYIIRLFLSFEIDWHLLLAPDVILLFLLFMVSQVVYIYVAALLWKRILVFFSQKEIPYSDIYPAYTKSNIAKYLPSGVMNYVSRNVLCRNMGLSQIQIAGASVVELGCSLIVNFFIVFIVARDQIFVVFERFVDYRQVLFLVAILGAIVLIISLIYVLRKKVDIKNIIKSYVNLKFVGLISLNSFVFLALTGVSTLFLMLTLNAMIPISFAHALAIIGSSAIALVVGMMTPGVPGGIGVREAVFTFLLYGLFNPEVLILFALIQRLSAVLADVFSFLITLLLERKTKKKLSST